MSDCAERFQYLDANQMLNICMQRVRILRPVGNALLVLMYGVYSVARTLRETSMSVQRGCSCPDPVYSAHAL
jgi:hypothetical protein